MRNLDWMGADVSAEDPNEAFLSLEDKLRDEYSRAVGKAGSDWAVLKAKQTYFVDVHVAAVHYCIEPLAKIPRPSYEDSQRDGFYDWFMGEVDYCLAGLYLRAADRTRSLSSPLSQSAREEILSLLRKARAQVSALDISEAKRDLILRRINALEMEIDGERARWATFGALMIEVCTDIGTAAEKLEPVVRTIERVGAALGWAQKGESSAKQLPPKEEPKQIEGPKPKQLDGPNRAKKLPDEVPF